MWEGPVWGRVSDPSAERSSAQLMLVLTCVERTLLSAALDVDFALDFDFALDPARSEGHHAPPAPP